MLLVLGAVFVVGATAVFVVGERFRRPPKPLKPAELEQVRRTVEERISDLAPRAMLLAQRERALREAVAVCGPQATEARRAGRLVEEAAGNGFWEAFAGAPALVDEDPLRALEEARRLPELLEAADAKLAEAERLLGEEPG